LKVKIGYDIERSSEKEIKNLALEEKYINNFVDQRLDMVKEDEYHIHVSFSICSLILRFCCNKSDEDIKFYLNSKKVFTEFDENLNEFLKIGYNIAPYQTNDFLELFEKFINVRNYESKSRPVELVDLPNKSFDKEDETLTKTINFDEENERKEETKIQINNNETVKKDNGEKVSKKINIYEENEKSEETKIQINNNNEILKKNQREKGSEKINIEKDFLKCPYCMNYVDVEGGNNFITCSSVNCQSKKYFCSICGKKLLQSEKISHYPNGLFSNLCKGKIPQ
jgi:hypothetical protein